LIQKKLRFIVLLKKIKTMLSKIHITPKIKDKISTAFLSENHDISAAGFLSEDEKRYLRKKLESGTECSVYKHPVLYFFTGTENNKQPSSKRESARCAGSKFYELLKAEKFNSIQITDDPNYPFTLSFLEGFLLSSYSFSRYKKEKEDYIPAEIFLVSDHITRKRLKRCVWEASWPLTRAVSTLLLLR
jgi:leucyl aminopeptidase